MGLKKTCNKVLKIPYRLIRVEKQRFFTQRDDKYHDNLIGLKCIRPQRLLNYQCEPERSEKRPPQCTFRAW